jgi:hypothetical protein
MSPPRELIGHIGERVGCSGCCSAWCGRTRVRQPSAGGPPAGGRTLPNRIHPAADPPFSSADASTWVGIRCADAVSAVPGAAPPL